MPKKLKAGLIAVLVTLLMFSPPIGLKMIIAHRNHADLTSVRASVYLIADEEGNNGSGVMISPHYMLTAAHVAVNDRLTVGPEKLPFKLIKMDKETDIALIKVALDCPCADLGEATTLDSEALTVGYPMHNSVKAQYATHGTFQGVVNGRLKTSAPILPGNSGGGTFAFQHGHWVLVGITIEGLGSCGFGGCFVEPEYNNSVDISAIKAFLEPEKKPAADPLANLYAG